MRRFFGSPWFVLALAFFVMAFGGVLNAERLIILILIAIALLGRIR